MIRNKIKTLKSVVIFSVIAAVFFFGAAASVRADTAGETLPENEVKLEAISLEDDSVDLFEGQSVSLKAAKVPEEATEEFVYTSSDPEVVTVEDGKITAGQINNEEMIANGIRYKDAEITVANQDGTISEVLKVRVKVAVKKITITPNRNGDTKYSVILKTNKSNSATLRIKVYPSNAYSSKYTVSFRKRKFKIRKTGENTYYIKAMPYKKKYISKFKVTSDQAGKKVVAAKYVYGVKVAKKIRVEREKTPKAKIRVHNINVGRKVDLKVVPVTKGVTTNAAIWKSSNPKIATVDRNGVVKALRKGKVKIVATCRYNRKCRAEFKFKVHKPVVLEWPIHKKFDDQYNVESYFGGGRGHNGIDIIVGSKKVYAAAEGMVTKVGYDGGWGKCVVVTHPGGGKTLYSHLRSYSKYAKKGKKVTTDTCLGVAGRTGRATCVHLHFEIHDKKGDEFSAIKKYSGGKNYNAPFKKSGEKYVYDPDFIWP